MAPLITLTTDFGTASPYVAAMKGVTLTIHADARIHDLTHAIPPQDVRHASFFLAGCVPFFPTGTIHVCVVDPGVGSERALLLAEAGGQRLLAPDNGCLTGVLDVLDGRPIVRQVTESRFWRHPVSATFHGRDILAPVAGHLSAGLEAAKLGPIVTDWVRLKLPPVRKGMNQIRGEVVFIDDFGNMLTNITSEMIKQPPALLMIGNATRKRFQWVRSYGEAAAGSLVALVSSQGWLEIAVVQGNAAARLKAAVGIPVVVGFAR